MPSGRNFPAMLRFIVVAALVVVQILPLGSSATSTKWLTLDGSAPKVVARGGFSGLFPDSSSFAYSVATATSVSDVVLWCDVQLTKDAAGICFPSLTLENSSSINTVHTNKSTYTVNGASTPGFFTIDYTFEQLGNVSLTQGIYSRTPDFDASGLPIQRVQDVFQQVTAGGFWVNVQHDLFFSQHKLSMQKSLLGVIKSGITIGYLSSPEVAFLRGIAPKLKQTNLVFRFLQEDDLEPTMNQTYGTLLKNLTFIKTFADGILVPKSYIWPFDSSSLYLLQHTSLVLDAHAAGLKVFAADFANDNVISYNYSYNPVAEYLQFIDNGDFSVDGILSDHPITPSEAIDCFAHLGKNAPVQATLVISHNGASGDYPGCTDLAYTRAISDGADIIDCPVQMSKDGVPFCLSTINLMDSTTIAQTRFINSEETIVELQMRGIFSFRLLWKDIQSLTPAISNIFSNFFLFRNPIYKNAGKLIALADFLRIARSSNNSGVSIVIENAAYLAQKLGMSVTDAVLKELNNAGFTNQTRNKVMIQSTNSSVLEVFKGRGYELVYELDEVISDLHNSTVTEIKSFADAVVVRKNSIYPDTGGFITGQTKVVEKLQASNLKVYAQVLRNEFVSQAWDFYSDPIVEINSFATGAGVDGIITDFPQTAAAYRKNRCLNRGNNIPPYMLPIQPRGLLDAMNPYVMPPAEAPAEVLSEADVSEAPLPTVVPVPSPSSTPVASAPKTSSSSDGNHLIVAFSSLATVLITAAIFLC